MFVVEGSGATSNTSGRRSLAKFGVCVCVCEREGFHIRASKMTSDERQAFKPIRKTPESDEVGALMTFAGYGTSSSSAKSRCLFGLNDVSLGAPGEKSITHVDG